LFNLIIITGTNWDWNFFRAWCPELYSDDSSFVCWGE